MKKLLLLLALMVAGIGIAHAESYTINFNSTANTATQLATTTKATTFIATNSQEYVEASPISSATSAYYGGNTPEEKTWIRIGKSKAAGEVTLKLSEKGQANATTIIVSAKKYSASDEDATLTLNGKSENITSTTFEDKVFTFSGDATVKTLAFSTNAPSSSSNRIYIQSITVNYTTEPVDLGELTATYGDNAIDNGGIATFFQGTAVKLHADYATSFEVSVNDETPIHLDASDDSADWIPGICDNASVSVIAKREIEGEEIQTSNTLTFNLTVKKAEYLIADWIVTGIDATNGGSVLNKPLICTETSSKGTWQAYHATAYSSTSGNAAQLGSSTAANTFNGGTLTLSDSDIPENANILSISLTGYNNSTIPAVWSIKVGEKTSDNTITFSNTVKTNTANVNLIGNSIVLTCKAATDNGNIKQTYISGISIRYEIPEEEDQPGEVIVDYIPQYCLEANDDKTELTVMDGTELTFTSLGAAAMQITTEDEGVELPEATNGDKISWTVPAETIATINVTAYSESGKKTTECVYTIASEEIEPATPEYIFETDSKTVLITTDAGALMIMAAPYVQTPEENVTIMAIEPQGWAFTASEDPKSHEFSYDGMESTMNVSVKSTTPTKESNAVSFYVSNDGLVSGIENVAADNDSAEAAYYNLQGQRVEADRAGIYIRVQGGKAEKFIVR